MGRISIPESTYFHGDEINQFIHIQVPMDLVVSDCFMNLSGDAKILYGLLLNRTGLSIRNGWEDDKGRTFINYTVEDVMKDLHISHSKASRLFTELSNMICIDTDDNEKSQWFGLIEKVRVLNKPSRIYVHKVEEVRRILENKDVDNSLEAEDENDKTSGHNVQRLDKSPSETAEIQVVPDIGRRSSQEWDDGRLKSETTDVTEIGRRTSQEWDDGHNGCETTVVSKVGQRSSQNQDENNKDSNNINQIYKDVSDKDSINNKTHAGRDMQAEKRLMDEMACTKFMFKEMVEYDQIANNLKFDKKLLDDVIDLIVEAYTFPGRVVIHEEVMPLELVQSRFDKYDKDIMEYALSQIQKRMFNAKNLKSYTLAILFNAVTTFNGNLYMEVNQDMMFHAK